MNNADGNNGGNSVFDDQTAIGGGGGGQQRLTNGLAGGSGGGGGARGSGGAGTVGQGNDGGDGGPSSLNGAGGGGGASAVGGVGDSFGGGGGGDGTASSISGSSVTYAGGGGGGFRTGASGGLGGAGGGGNGGAGTSQPVDGTDGLGGGGGGSATASTSTQSGAGGDGVVIVRYLTADGITATGGTITTSGGYTIHTFDASGTFEITNIAGAGPNGVGAAVAPALTLQAPTGDGAGNFSPTVVGTGAGNAPALSLASPIALAVGNHQSGPEGTGAAIAPALTLQSPTAAASGDHTDPALLPQPDFKILRGSVVMPAGQASVTLTDGVDYTLEAGIADDAWFFQIANNHFSGMGRTVSGNQQNTDDFTVSASQSGNDITITRDGTENDNRVDWQIIQYIGPAGGANEIKVREKGVATGATATATVPLPGSVADAADVVPFITGQRANNTGRNNMNQMLFTSEIVGSDAVFDRFTANLTFTLSYALVEFTGANWTITNEQFANPAGSGESNVTLGTAVADVTQTFLHCTYRYETTGNAGLDDASQRVRLASTTELAIDRESSVDPTLKRHSVWVLQNPAITVARYLGTMSGAGEEEVEDIAITAVADTEQTLTTLSNNSTGTGTAFPRGFINHLLIDDSTVRLRQSDNGQTSQYAIEVVELPSSVPAPVVPNPLWVGPGDVDTDLLVGELFDSYWVGPVDAIGTFDVLDAAGATVTVSRATPGASSLIFLADDALDGAGSPVTL